MFSYQINYSELHAVEFKQLDAVNYTIDVRY
jgi:hypothetical protein